MNKNLVQPKFRILATMLHLKSFIGEEEFDKVVDLGGSDGTLITIINAKEKHVYDQQPIRIYNNINYHTINFDEKQEWINNDLTISTEVVEHLRNHVSFLKKIYEKLNPNGKVFLTTIHDKVPPEKLILDKERGHLTRFSLEEIVDLMEEIGFETITAYGFRTKHYYEVKDKGIKSFYEYDYMKDRLTNTKEKKLSSGLIYGGIKNV